MRLQPAQQEGHQLGVAAVPEVADVEVDEFLDEIADEYERLFKENIDLQERVEALGALSQFMGGMQPFLQIVPGMILPG